MSAQFYRDARGGTSSKWRRARQGVVRTANTDTLVLTTPASPARAGTDTLVLTTPCLARPTRTRSSSRPLPHPLAPDPDTLVLTTPASPARAGTDTLAHETPDSPLRIIHPAHQPHGV